MIIGLAFFTTLPSHAFQSEESSNDTDGGAFEERDGLVLLQTDMIISDNLALNKTAANLEAAGATAAVTGIAWNSVMQKVWAFLGCSESLTAGATAAAENAKRFHRDFIAAALLMCCVLPWARRQDGEAAHGREHTSAGHVADEFERSSFPSMSELCCDFPNGLLHIFPAFHGLRYISVMLLWLQHYWFQGSLSASQPLLLLAGIVLDFMETRRPSEDNIWTKYAGAVPERFTRLYPLYALHVILCYLSFPVPGLADTEGSFLQRTFSGSAWIVSVVFGSYILLPVLTDQPQDIPDNIVAMLSAACVALVVLPRTLAFPALPATAEKPLLLDSSRDTAVAEMIFAHKTLLYGLAYFFTGMVIGRVCLSLKLDRYVPQIAQLVCLGSKKVESNFEEADKPSVQLQEASFGDEGLSHSELLGSQDLLSSDLLADCLDSQSQLSD
mmetsp:Transcript_117473/g.226588  ORF Transcript_117473/g.226588 Transcript_117473/m.226588 type:complete len:442 (+) Transcript_117473:2-1327(+)